MTIKPLKDGGRSLHIDTAYLLLDATVSVGGVVNVHVCEVREPTPPESPIERNSPAESETIAHRLPICLACDAIKAHKPDLNAVSCRDCGCGNLKLATGTCPRGKWSAVTPPRT